MSNNKIQEQILALKGRNEFGHAYFNVNRLETLKTIAEKHLLAEDSTFTEFFKYLPIATVATIESFMRSALASLIDCGGIYLANAKDLFETTVKKLDFNMLTSLQDKHFTIGELVAHMARCNNIADLESNFSKVIGMPIFEELKNHVHYNIGEYDMDTTNNFRNRFEAVKKSIADTFEKRHIFCHESTHEIRISKVELLVDLENCILFLEMISNYVCLIVYEDWGLSVQDKVGKLSATYKSRQAALDDKLKVIHDERKKSSDWPEVFQEKFDAFILHWNAFLKAKAELKSSYSASATWSDYISLQDKIKSIDALMEEIY